jgi:hypothetical protein
MVRVAPVLDPMHTAGCQCTPEAYPYRCKQNHCILLTKGSAAGHDPPQHRQSQHHNICTAVLPALTSRSDLLDLLAQQEAVIECVQLLTLWQLIAGTNKCDKWDLQEGKGMFPGFLT